MQDVMWMFQENEDTDSDVTLMSEHRTELSEFSKVAEKILSIKGGTTAFDLLAGKMKDLSNRAKAGLIGGIIYKILSTYHT